jgi:hypothetical protein
MSCLLCGSGNVSEFSAEINLRFSGLENLDKPSVLVFPQVLVCLDCSFSRFTTPETELGLLRTQADKARGEQESGRTTP